MKDTIIIIESPNKCEKIAQYTGAKVFATKGHFKTLANHNDYVDWDNQYTPRFITKEDSKKHMNYIFSTCKNKNVIIATDPDREGYAIGYMFYDTIKNIAKSIKRAEFHEITKEGVQKGLSHAIDFQATNKNFFESFKARAVGDKMVGYILSPKLGKKFGSFKNVSVGRVQTPALALIVKRELEIEEFNKTPKEQRLSYKINALLNINGVEFLASHANVFATKQEAQDSLNSIHNTKEAIISKIETKESKKAPPKPFQTVTLIKKANTVLNFSSDTTMNLAQSLFEKGLITYHRTDSEIISESFLSEIENSFGQEEWYHKRIYNAGKYSQAEAHEAIRITHIQKDKELENLSKDERNLYELIYNNTIYSQAKDSLNNITNYSFNIAGRIFTNSLSIPVYTSIFEKGEASEKGDSKDYTESNNENDLSPTQQVSCKDYEAFSKVKEGDIITIKDFQIKEIEKKPPSRYRESDFIPLLQKEGIGRPSTYATFIKTLLHREYIQIQKKGKKEEIEATLKGKQAIAYLNEMKDTWITTSDFTKNMEQILDCITESKATYLDFILPLHQRMNFEIPASIEKKPPTDSQINYAKTLAQQHKVELPKEALETMKACSDFIDQYKPKQKKSKLKG